VKKIRQRLKAVLDDGGDELALVRVGGVRRGEGGVLQRTWKPGRQPRTAWLVGPLRAVQRQQQLRQRLDVAARRRTACTYPRQLNQ
jgi:hypothetical protein